MSAKPPRGKEAGKAFVPAAERCQGQAGLSPNPAPQAWPQSLFSLLSAWACLYCTGGRKALELPRRLGGLLSPWLWPLLLLSGSAGYALLQPPPLRPPGLLLSWVSREQSLRLLWRPWRRGEDRAEGPSPLECPTPGDLRPDLWVHSFPSQDPRRPCQPAATVLSLGDSGGSSLEEWRTFPLPTSPGRSLCRW